MRAKTSKRRFNHGTKDFMKLLDSQLDGLRLEGIKLPNEKAFLISSVLMSDRSHPSNSFELLNSLQYFKFRFLVLNA